MAVQMPFSKKFGIWSVFLFGFSSIFIYDILTMKFGVWTIITAFAYGFVGVGASLYFRNKNGARGYVVYSIIGTIAYDAFTGLTIGPMFFGQSFMVSLIGQIPFTLIHLLGNISFAILLSPLIEKWTIKESVVQKSVRIISSVEI